MKKNATPPQLFMSPLEMQMRVKAIRDELENRHKTGLAKMASKDGEPISTEALQNEIFSLIYRLSKLE
jgi:hypothetical protein